MNQGNSSAVSESEVDEGRRGAGDKEKQASSSLMALIATDQSNCPASAHALVPMIVSLYLVFSFRSGRRPAFAESIKLA
jgi:hypothetical protein